MRLNLMFYQKSLYDQIVSNQNNLPLHAKSIRFKNKFSEFVNFDEKMCIYLKNAVQCQRNIIHSFQNNESRHTKQKPIISFFPLSKQGLSDQRERKKVHFHTFIYQDQSFIKDCRPKLNLKIQNKEMGTNQVGAKVSIFTIEFVLFCLKIEKANS